MNCSQGNRTIMQFIDKINREYQDIFPHCRNSRTRRFIKTKWLFNGMNEDTWNVFSEEIKHGDIDNYTWTQISDAAQDAEWLAKLGQNKHFIRRARKPQSAGNYTKEGFLHDEDGYVQVYTDGACLRNGSDFPAAGIGIFFNYNHPL